MLKAWCANNDLQPIPNYYKTVEYFYEYKNEISEALCQAEKEIKTQKLKAKEAVHKIANSFTNAP